MNIGIPETRFNITVNAQTIGIILTSITLIITSVLYVENTYAKKSVVVAELDKVVAATVFYSKEHRLKHLNESYDTLLYRHSKLANKLSTNNASGYDKARLETIQLQLNRIDRQLKIELNTNN